MAGPGRVTYHIENALGDSSDRAESQDSDRPVAMLLSGVLFILHIQHFRTIQTGNTARSTWRMFILCESKKRIIQIGSRVLIIIKKSVVYVFDHTRSDVMNVRISFTLS